MLGGTNSFVGQFLHPSLVQSSRSFHACKQFKGPNKFLLFYNLEDQSLFHRSKTQEENLLSGTNSFVRQFLHPSLVQNLRSIPHMQTVQGPKQISSLVQLGRPVLFHRSRNSGREFVVWNQLLCRSVLTPISCTKFNIHPMHADRQSKGPNKLLFFYNLEDQSLFHRSRNLETKFDRWNELVRRSVTEPFSCSKFTIHSTHVNKTRAQTNFFSCTIWKTSLCFIDQNLKKRICWVEPTPL